MTKLVTNPIHLYRSILRETSYLFDPNASIFCRQYVSSQFRRHRKTVPLKQKDSSLERFPSKIETGRLKRGRKFLYLLERANRGNVAAVEKVLKLTYARKGKRRRQLMSQLMPSEPADPMAEDGGRTVDKSSRDWRPPQTFMALAKSQAQIEGHLDRTRNVKLSAKIPEKNSWGRPMPKCRVKNKNQAWYAQNANRLLPPLMENEWQDIYDKTVGKKAMQPHRTMKRRPQGTVGILTPATDPVSVEADRLAAILVDGVSRNPDHLVKDPRDHTNVKGIRGLNPHRLTPRFLRRRMARAVLRYTPLAISRGEGQKVAFRWEAGTVDRQKPKPINESQINSLFT